MYMLIVAYTVAAMLNTTLINLLKFIKHRYKYFKFAELMASRFHTRLVFGSVIYIKEIF